MAFAFGSRQDGKSAGYIQLAVLALTAFLVLGPLVPLIYQALLDRPIYDPAAQLSFANFPRLLGDPDFHNAVLNTVAFATIATIVAQIIAVVTAILLTRTDIPGRALIGGLLLVPLFVSHLVLAIGYYTMYGPAGFITLWFQQTLSFVPWDLYTIPGMAVVAGMSQAPLAYLFCVAATKNTDPTLESAASIAGARPLRVLYDVTLPLMRPAIIYGLSINFVISIEMLAIPLIFGQSSDIDVFSVYIYKNILRTEVPDHGLVGVGAIMLLIVVLGLLYVQNRLTQNAQRFVTVGGKSSRPKRFSLGAAKWPAFALLLIYVVATIILPLGGLVVRSFTEIFTPLLPIVEVLTLSNYQEALSTPLVQRSIVNTLVVSVATAFLCTALVFAIAVVTWRSGFTGAKMLEYIAQVPRAIPGVFAGVALLYFVLAVPFLGWFRSTVLILVFAYLTRFIPIGIGAVQPALQQISTDLESSARVIGASWWQANVSILLPLLKPALFACFAIVFIHALKEYVTAIFLVSPGSEVIAASLLSAWQEGQLGLVSALATILILLTGFFVFFFGAVMKVKFYE